MPALGSVSGYASACLWGSRTVGGGVDRINDWDLEISFPVVILKLRDDDPVGKGESRKGDGKYGF